MSTDIDLRQQLRLPVFDPDYYPTRVGRTSHQHRQQQPSSDSSQETHSDDTSDENDRKSYERPSTKSPNSSEHKAVRFRWEQERGRTAAGNDVGNAGDDRAAPSRRNNDVERATAAKKKKKKAVTKALKWRPANVDADSQPIGTRTRQRQYEDDDADSQPTKNTRSAAGGEGRSKSAAATHEQKAVRPAAFYPRYKYPAKFHRIAGVTAETKQSNELIPGNFNVPDCLRRPTGIHLLPVRQGPHTVSGSRDERNRKKDRPSTTSGARRGEDKTNDDNRSPKNESTDASAAELNGTYHVVHAETRNVATSKRRNKSNSDRGKDSDPETAVSKERVPSRSTSSDSEGDNESDVEAGRRSSNVASEDKSGAESKTSAADQQKAGRKSSDVSDDDGDGGGNYSDDFDD